MSAATVLRFPALAALLSSSLISTVAATLWIDSFETPNAPAPWTFSNGPEFPGATGSLTRGAGHTGQCAHLAYDLSKGGHYVGALRTLPSPVNAKAIAFWAKSPAGIHVVLRVGDQTGQTLQFSLMRPPTAMDASQWYHQVIPLESATGWWGGANDGTLHPPVRNLSILAADPWTTNVVGAIDIDEVSALDSITLALDPANQPLAPPPPGSPTLQSRWGVNIHFTSDNRALDLARGAGLTWIRMDLIWSSVETRKGTYDWSAYDALVKSIEARAMRTLFILDYGNALYSAGARPPTDLDSIQAFARFSQSAASHFAGHDVSFEIWNEPNISVFWPPNPDPSQYAVLARQTIAAVHQGNPAAMVTTGGLSTFDQAFAAGFLALGGGTGADAVGIHPYLGAPEDMPDDLVLLRSIVTQSLSNAPPVWSTEWGYSSANYGDGHSPEARRRQAILATREMLCCWAAGFPIAIYYDIRDDGTVSTNTEHNFGLLAHDYTDKPAMQALRTLNAVASGRTLAGFPLTEPSTVAALRMDGLSNIVVALWMPSAGASVNVTVPTNTTAMDFLGNPLPLGLSGSWALLTVSESDGPVYLTFPTSIDGEIPRLQYLIANRSITLSWPLWGSDFRLETTKAADSWVWSAVTNAPTYYTNAWEILTLPMETGGGAYFRLARP